MKRLFQNIFLFSVFASSSWADDVRPGQIALEMEALQSVRAELFSETNKLFDSVASGTWIGAFSAVMCDTADRGAADKAGKIAMAQLQSILDRYSKAGFYLSEEEHKKTRQLYQGCVYDENNPGYVLSQKASAGLALAEEQAALVLKLDHYITVLQVELFVSIDANSSPTQ